MVLVHQLQQLRTVALLGGGVVDQLEAVRLDQRVLILRPRLAARVRKDDRGRTGFT